MGNNKGYTGGSLVVYIVAFAILIIILVLVTRSFRSASEVEAQRNILEEQREDFKRDMSSGIAFSGRKTEMVTIKVPKVAFRENHPVILKCVSDGIARDLCIKSAHGDPEAFYEVSQSYLDGNKITQDLNAGFQWLNYAVESGSHKAELALGQMYLSGNGTRVNLDKACVLLKESLALESSEAYEYYGDCLKAQGNLTPEKLKKVESLYRLALTKGSETVQEKLQALLANANDGASTSDSELEKGINLYKEGKFPEALVILDKLCESSAFEACFISGSIYHRNVKDAVKSEEVLQKGTASSDTSTAGKSFNELGVIAEENADFKKAFDFWQKADTLGNPEGTSNLGFAYLEGKGTGKNYKEAEKYFKKAMAVGVPEAYLGLSLIYFKGPNPNAELALSYAEKASELGVPEAFKVLGDYYQKIDPVKAREYYRKASSLKSE